jgi:hypothetical protein
MSGHTRTAAIFSVSGHLAGYVLRCDPDSDDELRIDPQHNESPAGGPCLARNRLLLAARKPESGEADAEQRERCGFGYGRLP